MSDSDSFLNEVSEEVRRDQLIAFLRRNALWIGGALVLIIGGAGYFEWQKASTRAAAEARGDALLSAMQTDDPQARLTALEAIALPGADGGALLALDRAAAQVAAGSRAEAVETLRGLAASGDVSEPLRNVARLKIAALGVGVIAADQREEVLLPMLAEGHAMRSLALEQRALLRLEAGDGDAALADLRAIDEDPRAPAALRDRAAQLLTILEPADAGAGAADGPANDG